MAFASKSENSPNALISEQVHRIELQGIEIYPTNVKHQILGAVCFM
jgi:hypothetical protein